MIKPFLTKWPFLLKLRLFFIVLGLIIVLVFLYLKVVPFGRATYERAYPGGLKSGQGFIYGFTPAERVDAAGVYPKLISDPLYFSLFTPRTFDSVKLTIIYRDHLGDNTFLVEAGVLADKLTWRYDLQPLQNKILENWAAIRQRVGTGTPLILSKTDSYDSAADFWADLKAGQLKNCAGGAGTCLAVYNYPLDLPYKFPAGTTVAPLTINQPLRGTHQFYIYTPDGDLSLVIDFLLLRQDKGADPITVNLYQGDKIIATKFAADNRPGATDGQTEIKSLSLAASGLAPGVYKAEMKISDDTVIKKIISSSDKLAFINKLWPVSGPEPATFYTDADYLQAKAFTPASLQTLNFAGQAVALDEAYKQFTFLAASSMADQTAVKAIKINKEDVILENNGVFALSPESVFDPALKKVDNHFNAAAVNYIIADYTAPRPLADGWKSATAEFNLKTAYRETGQYSFMISIPGLVAESGAYLEIKDIKTEFSGRTLGQKLKSLWTRIK